MELYPFGSTIRLIFLSHVKFNSSFCVEKQLASNYVCPYSDPSLDEMLIIYNIGSLNNL